MTTCGDKNLLSNTCTVRTNSRCIDYDGNVSNNSSLKNETCINIHDTTEDLYELSENIESQLVPPTLVSNSCLSYPNNPTHSDILLTLDSVICNIKSTQTTNALDYDVKDLDLKCLTTPCGDQISNVRELLQVLIDKVCECCGE